MNLILNPKYPRQGTASRAINTLAIREGLHPEPNGSISYEMLHAYLANEGNRILRNEISTGTLAGYLSALSAAHIDNGIDWRNIRNDFRITRQLSLINKNPENPPRITNQD
jgi:hypothetical protein